MLLDPCYRLEPDLEKKWGDRPASGSPPGFISISSVDLYLRCPKAWEFRYLLKPEIPDRDDTPLRFGSALHKALELIYGQYLREGVFPDVMEVGGFVEQGMLSTGPWGPAEKVKLTQEGFKLVNNFLATGGRAIRPVLSELQFLLMGPSDLKIVGAIDLTTVDSVRDFKVTWHPRTLDKASDQLNLYAAVFYLMTGGWPADLEIINLVRSTGTVNYLTLRCDPGEVVKSLKKVEEIWLKSRTPPYTPSPSAQACRYCDYRSLCPDRK